MRAQTRGSRDAAPLLNTIQKPLKLMERLVSASSNEGDVVLDPFCGVGTSLVACEKLGRSYVGFEQNKEFIAQAKKRLRKADKQRAELLF